MAIGYLGPEGTFTHAAARQLCPGADLTPLGTQAQAIARVEDGTLDGAVVPVDNTVNGVVLPTWDALLSTTGTRIVADTLVQVTFDAFALSDDVVPEVVVSHPHALAQCARYVASLGVPTRAASSTAEACASLAPGEIAIAAPVCAELYPVARVATRVEDGAGATTHFGLVAREDRSTGSERWTSVFAALPARNAPGSLAALLAPVAELGCNLENIVARPVRGTSDYVFLLFVADVDAAREERLTEALGSHSTSVSLLGRLALSKPGDPQDGASSGVPVRLAGGTA